MSEAVIRDATAADRLAIEQLVQQAYEPYLARMDRPPAPMLQDFAELILAGECRVAVRDGAVVGLLVTRPIGADLLVENLAVARAARRTGIGARLLAEAESQAVRLGLRRVVLYTNEAMTENLAYYPRRGYRETSRTTDGGYRRVHFAKSVP
jgi:N-acetylglutamate synthase-like GNAT family acetyltransferase